MLRGVDSVSSVRPPSGACSRVPVPVPAGASVSSSICPLLPPPTPCPLVTHSPVPLSPFKVRPPSTASRMHLPSLRTAGLLVWPDGNSCPLALVLAPLPHTGSAPCPLPTGPLFPLPSSLPPRVSVQLVAPSGCPSGPASHQGPILRLIPAAGVSPGGHVHPAGSAGFAELPRGHRAPGVCVLDTCQ